MATEDLARFQGLAAAEAHRLGVEGDEAFPAGRRPSVRGEAEKSTGEGETAAATKNEGDASFGVNLGHITGETAATQAVQASTQELQHMVADHSRSPLSAS